jgi:transposase-like protein
MLGSVGDFCPHEGCENYGKVERNSIIKYGLSRAGRQRYQCKTCKKVFNENKGTLFYRRQVSSKEIIECLALLAKGTSMSALSEVKGYKADTIASWLSEAASHSEAVGQLLMKDYEVSRSQIDGLWSYVGHKGSKKGAVRQLRQVRSGAVPSLR